MSYNSGQKENLRIWQIVEFQYAPQLLSYIKIMAIDENNYYEPIEYVWG